MDSGGDAAKDPPDQASLYDMMERLQQMTTEIPRTLQQRLPPELLSSLASSLVEGGGQVFEIVAALTDLQNASEKAHFRRRAELQRSHADERRDFDGRYRAAVAEEERPEQLMELTRALDREKEEMRRKQEESLRQFDTDLVLQIDQKVAEQQQTLESAGVPGFRVTNNPTEIKVQMHLVDFIRRLNPNLQ